MSKKLNFGETDEALVVFQVFKNHGAAAGASMSHSHSQMLAMPIIPLAVSARLGSMKECFDRTQRCSICEAEAQRDDLLIDASTHFVSVAPFASTFPFEIWILPRDHSHHFHEIDADKVIITTTPWIYFYRSIVLPILLTIEFSSDGIRIVYSDEMI